MLGGLDSIRSISSGNLSDGRLLRVSRKLRWTSRRRDKSIRKDILEYPGCSRSSNTSFGGNLVNRKTIGVTCSIQKDSLGSSDSRQVILMERPTSF